MENQTEGLWSGSHDQRATETACAAKALVKLRRWEWENEEARETANGDKV